MHNSIFIPFNVPSMKNGRPNGKFYSKPVKQYLQNVGVKSFSSSKKTFENYKTRPNIFHEKIWQLKKPTKFPAEFYFHFVRDSHRQFDFCNAVQILSDLMTAHGFIPDDNMDYFLPFPWHRLVYNNEYSWYSVDKENPGVHIWIK